MASRNDARRWLGRMIGDKAAWMVDDEGLDKVAAFVTKAEQTAESLTHVCKASGELAVAIKIIAPFLAPAARHKLMEIQSVLQKVGNALGPNV